MGSIVGRGIRVEVGKTEGPAIVVTGVTNAKPGVASAAAHGLLAKSIGYFKDVTGMVQMEGQSCRVANPAAGTFELENQDTSKFPAFTGGKFIPIIAWETVSEVTAYNIPDGTADELDDTKLIDEVKQSIAGLLNAQNPSFPINAQETPSAGMQLCEAAAEAQEYLVFRLTYKSQVVKHFRASPSLPGENVGKGSIGTGNLNTTVKGRIRRGAA